MPVRASPSGPPRRSPVSSADFPFRSVRRGAGFGPLFFVLEVDMLIDLFFGLLGALGGWAAAAGMKDG